MRPEGSEREDRAGRGPGSADPSPARGAPPWDRAERRAAEQASRAHSEAGRAAVRPTQEPEGHRTPEADREVPGLRPHRRTAAAEPRAPSQLVRRGTASPH